MQWIDVNGVVMRYRLEGSEGPVVALVHEMGGMLESWDDVAHTLAQSYRVLRYDMRGSGLSEKIHCDVTMEELADDLAGLLDLLDIKDRVAVVGCAMGGAVALYFAGKYPERASAVVAMSPAAGVPSDLRDERLAAADRIAVTGLRAVDTKAAYENTYPSVLQDLDNNRFNRFRLRKLTFDPVSLRYLLRMVVNTDLSDLLPRIACPVLGIGGLYDKARPAKATEAMIAQVPNHKYQALQTGHYMPISNPEELSNILANFLAEVKPA